MLPYNNLTIYTVKRVDEVVRHPHLVTQDQFTQVSKKVSDIQDENFTINIKLFQQNFTFVELLRCKTFPTSKFVEDDHRTSPTDCSFKYVELLRHSCKVSKGASSGARTYTFRFTFRHATTAPHFLTYLIHSG